MIVLQYTMKSLIFLALTSSLVPCIRGFTPFIVPSSRCEPLSATQHQHSLDDLDERRLAFEELMKDSNTSAAPMSSQSLPTNNNNKGYQQQHQPIPDDILTSTSRHRRQLEIELLDSLRHSEDAVDELMHLWMYEHDADSAARLEAMSVFCTPEMQEEEDDLRQMIDEYPTWAEPCLRLAMLLYYKGRTSEAYDMAERAVIIKPWHFELYPIIIMLHLRENRLADAIRWARRAMPPIRENHSNKRRRKWVDWAVETATQSWREAEEAAQDLMHQKTTVDKNMWQ